MGRKARCQLVLLVMPMLLHPLAAVAAEARLFLVNDLARGADHAPVRAQAQELAEIHADLVRVSGVDATLVYSTDADINAFATLDGDLPIVVVQAGLLGTLEHDRDAVAATLAHELAHHRRDHLRAGKRKQQGVRLLGVILGAVVGARVGRSRGELAGALSGAAVGVGANLLALKFSRGQELEADRLTVDWMLDAGYDPHGMLRLQQRLGELAAGRRQVPISSTHPSSAKRMKAAQARIEQRGPNASSRSLRPLVDPQALALAEHAVAEARAARLAQESARPAPDAALQGDAAAQALRSGVSIGPGVSIGDRVRIGGKPAAPTPTQGDGDD